jgi:DNA invertase Pin-like site-specific DNA recombinase
MAQTKHHFWLEQMRAAEKRRGEIVQLERQGVKRADIARLFGISRQRVTQILQSEGIQSARPRAD